MAEMEPEEHVDSPEETEPNEAPTPQKKVKKKKKSETEAGVIYLSRIPTGMNVTKVRQVFEQYGEVGRMFIQPDEKASKHKKNRIFTEGWVEFMDKKIAKRVAMALNNNKVGGKKRARWHEELWNIKYLHRFKWGHLNEKLAYERAVHNQRLRAEISQVKKESHFFIQNVEKKQRLKKYESKHKTEVSVREWTFAQKDTEDVILSRKKRKAESVETGSSPEKKAKGAAGPLGKSKACLNQNFLKSLFSGGVASNDD